MKIEATILDNEGTPGVVLVHPKSRAQTWKFNDNEDAHTALAIAEYVYALGKETGRHRLRCAIRAALGIKEDVL